MKKLCMDCRHIIDTDCGYMCGLYPVQYTMPVSDRKCYPQFCSTERKSGKCGPEGKLWEPDFWYLLKLKLWRLFIEKWET